MTIFFFQILEDGASYQEIIACDKIPPNDGCKGGVPRLVWDWAEAFSVASNMCYEYVAGSGDEAPSCMDYLLNSSPKRGGCENKYKPPPTTPSSCLISLQIPCEEGFHHTLHDR